MQSPQSPRATITLILFDLDGTLIDSRSDLIASVNRMLVECGADALDQDRIASFIGQGMTHLVRRSLDAAGAQTDLATATRLFDEIYAEQLLDETAPYPGVEQTLDALAGYTRAVLTNKPTRHARAILSALGIDGRFTAVYGGDSFAELKPSPLPVLSALGLLGRPPQECVLVGDSTYDLDAGKAAKVWTCAALYGFQDREQLLRRGPDAAIETFPELPEAIGRLQFT